MVCAIERAVRRRWLSSRDWWILGEVAKRTYRFWQDALCLAGVFWRMCKSYSGSGVASLTYYFHRVCHHLHPLKALQSPPSTPLHPNYPHQSLPQIPPKSTNIIALYLPLTRPSVFPATTILSHYLKLITVFSYLPSRDVLVLYRIFDLLEGD